MQFVLALMLLVHPGHETTGCESLHWQGAEAVYMSESRAVLNAVRVLREIGSIEMPIMVCESQGTGGEYVPLAASQIHEDARGVKTGYVHIPRAVALEYTPEALFGVIAHEMAHFVVPLKSECRLLPLRLDPVTDEERAACEMPVDAQAAVWLREVGPVWSFLRETYVLLLPYAISDEERVALKRHIQLRIDALAER